MYSVIAIVGKSYKQMNSDFENIGLARKFKAGLDPESKPMIVPAQLVDHAIELNNYRLG